MATSTPAKALRQSASQLHCSGWSAHGVRYDQAQDLPRPTCNCALHDRAILQLDLYSLIAELHQKPARGELQISAFGRA